MSRARLGWGLVLLAEVFGVVDRNATGFAFRVTERTRDNARRKRGDWHAGADGCAQPTRQPPDERTCRDDQE